MAGLDETVDRAGGRFELSPADPAFVQDPYPAYQRMRGAGQAFFWQDYGLCCLPGFAEVDAAMRDRRFGREPPFGREFPQHLAPFYAFESRSMLELEPPKHTRLRRLVNRAFVSREVERLRPRLEQFAHERIDGFGETFELIDEFAAPLAVTMIAELLGTPVECSARMLDWSHGMVAMYEFGRDRVAEENAVRATLEFSAFMQEHIDQRRKQPADDLITRLVAVEEEGRGLTSDELVTTCILLMNAGHEATVHAIANGVKALIENGIDPLPHLGDPASARLAVDELLRFDAPLHMFTRYANEDFGFAGLSLRKGQEIGLLLGSANRDPLRFADPDKLDLSRDQGGHMSFGAGIHFCVGAPLARLEIEVAIRVLFERLGMPCLAERPVYADRYHFHGLERLLLTRG
ncbi:MAG: cytochrome P450 [Geminicoccaceae bacterium]